ncbi:MAG: hypothetical protein K8W52_25055 [Deltaproteobacteria bacterium]|nr:hypothetical protein [Deltaproteobacteria bacterium]
MFATREIRHAVAESRRRGLPALGFVCDAPDALVWTAGEASTIGTAIERAADGAVIGEITFAIVGASLIMDRDGILADTAHAGAARAAGEHATSDEALGPTASAGASGSVAALVQLGRPPLPYVSVYALASDDVVAGALLVTVRHEAPEWPAAEALVASIRVASKDALLGRATAPRRSTG